MVCLLFPARQAGRTAACRRLLPYLPCAEGWGRAGRGAAPAAGAHGPRPQPLSAPRSLRQDLPSHVYGVCMVPTAQHRPQGEPEEPRKPSVPTPRILIMWMHNPPPFHLPFTFSPAFATNISPAPASLPLPSQLIFFSYPSHLFSLGSVSPSSPSCPFP